MPAESPNAPIEFSMTVDLLREDPKVIRYLADAALGDFDLREQYVRPFNEAISRAIKDDYVTAAPVVLELSQSDVDMTQAAAAGAMIDLYSAYQEAGEPVPRSVAGTWASLLLGSGEEQITAREMLGFAIYDDSLSRDNLVFLVQEIVGRGVAMASELRERGVELPPSDG